MTNDTITLPIEVFEQYKSTMVKLQEGLDYLNSPSATSAITKQVSELYARIEELEEQQKQHKIIMKACLKDGLMKEIRENKGGVSKNKNLKKQALPVPTVVVRPERPIVEEIPGEWELLSKYGEADVRWNRVKFVKIGEGFVECIDDGRGKYIARCQIDTTTDLIGNRLKTTHPSHSTYESTDRFIQNGRLHMVLRDAATRTDLVLTYRRV